MFNQVNNFRKKSNCQLWRVFVFLWIISISNTLLFPAFTVPLKERTESVYIQSSQTAKTSALEHFLLLVFTSVDFNADLADTSEDASDKIEFVSSRYFLLREAQQNSEPKPSSHLHGTLISADLEESTPPPKVG